MKPIERAREHVFMAGTDDVGARLCEANVPYGLAKIHHVQDSLGLPADASFVGSPDCTITRNERRWKQGFGYGGVYEWTGDFAVLDIKTNACGMLVGALPDLPALEAVRARYHDLEREGLHLDGVALDNDLTESNHFVDVLSARDEGSSEPAPGGAKHFFIMHSSGHEHRDASGRGPGLYFDQSEELAAMARVFDTPWGSIRILEGAAARDWYAFYRNVQDFNHRRREALASYLFGDFEVVVNATHQGLVRGLNKANVGCYHYDLEAGGELPIYPLTLSPTLPCYLVRGKPNITEEVAERLGWSERMARHGLTDRLRDTNLLPHGGGYKYPQFSGVARVIERGPDDRLFELASADGAEPTLIEAPRALPYEYRGMEVKGLMEELDLGEAVVELDLEYILTA